MSSSFVQVPQTYNSLLGEEDIPSSLLPGKQSRMVPASTSLKSVRTGSAAATPSSTSLFQIQTAAGAGYLKPNSVYVSGRLTLTIPVTGANPSWRFSGPQESIPLGGVGLGTNSGVHSASALISRVTVSNGSQQLSQIQQYNVYADFLKAHAASTTYTAIDSSIYEFTGVTRTVSAVPTQQELEIHFAIPLMSPVWSGDQAVPLFLLNSPLTVEILTNSIADAFVTNNATITNYSISNLQLCYESIDVSADLKNAIMDKLRQGQVWRQFMDQVYVINTSAEQGNSYNIGLGVSSLKGVLWADRQPSAGRVSAFAQTGDLILNGFSNCRFSIDGRNINQYDLTDDCMVFSEMNRALATMHDSNRTTIMTKNNFPVPGVQGWYDFNLNRFVVGCSMNAVNDYSVSFSGQPCQMLTIQHQNLTPVNSSNFPYVNETWAAGGQRIYVCLYDELLTIDANGTCSLIR